MNVERHLEIRKPLDQLEEEVVRRALARPGEVSSSLVDALRYVISFARLTVIRNGEGNDYDISGFIAPHSWMVRSVLAPRLLSLGRDP